jgi:hypothetical protein
MNSNTENSIASVVIARWENSDETFLDPGHISYIKNPNTPPETDAEEL